MTSLPNHHPHPHRSTRDGRVPVAVNEVDQALLQASLLGDLASLRRCLASPDVNVNVCHFGKRTPLHLACSLWHWDAVELLCQHDQIDVERRDQNGWTALHFASFHGRLETVTLLLRRGAHVNQQNHRGDTALHIAAEVGNVDLVRLLLAQGDEGDEDNNHTKIDVNRRNQRGNTPLHKACCHNRSLGVVQCLAQHTDLTIVNADQDTPLHTACWFGCYPTVHWMLSHSYGNVNGHVDSSSSSSPSYTPLMRAALEGHVRIVKCLLDHGAAVNMARLTGGTALYDAVRGKHLDTVRLLLRDGRADVNTRLVDTGWTVLLYACDRGWLAMVELLVAHGARVHVTAARGERPLYVAARGGHAAVVDCLLRNYHRHNHHNEDHDDHDNHDPRLTETAVVTAIQLAAQRNHRETVWRLIQWIWGDPAR